MKIPSKISSSLTFIILLIFSCSSAASADEHEDFLECLSQEFKNYSSISNLVYTTTNSSYPSILQFSIRNLRFDLESTPKPQVIITPDHESQIPPLIYCAKQSDLEIKTRGGGHDIEGLSYVAQVPFVIIDLINLSEITVDAAEKTAWIGGGGTLGSLYYRIAEKSPTLGFPAGFCPTVGVGGHISGGGYGSLLRKYGLAGDNVLDARIVDVNGIIHDRKSMGEDLFWAIRGGGGASFGVIVAWKVQLVDVPETVTVFALGKTFEENAIPLIHRWQYVAPKADKDLYMGVALTQVNSSQEGRKPTVRALFFSRFLGGTDRLLALMQETFPELGLVREDCTEMSFIQSVLYLSGFPVIPPPQPLPLELLLNRTPANMANLKMKSDYVQKPIPEYGIKGLERLFSEPEAAASFITMVPLGGIMSEISESATPYPHREGNLYELALGASWGADAPLNSKRYISWSRRYYRYVAPFVPSSPRAAYYNYRDLDLGVNNVDGNTSYEQASIWGLKYFKDNFDRLVRVKTVVDPDNFFKNEQSIPSLSSTWNVKGHQDI